MKSRDRIEQPGKYECRQEKFINGQRTSNRKKTAMYLCKKKTSSSSQTLKRGNVLFMKT